MIKIFIQFFLIIGILTIFFAFQDSFKQKTNIPEVLKLLEEKEKLLEANQIELAIEKIIEVKNIYIQHQEWESAVYSYHEAINLSEQILKIDQKQDYIDQALILINQYLSRQDLVSAKILQKKGEFYLSTAELDSAIIVLSEVKELFNSHEIWEEKAWVTYSIAIAYYYKKDYSNMEKFLLETEDIAKSKNLSDEIFTAVYELLGTLYYSTKSDYEKAIEVTNKSFQYYLNKENKTLIDSQFIINIHNNLGVYQEAKKDYNRAAHHFKQALSLNNKIGVDDFENIGTLVNYARVLKQLKKHELSITKQNQALEINLNQPIEAQKKKYNSAIYLGLSENYRALEQLDSAVYFVNQVISISKNHINNKAILISAELAYVNGQYEKAITKIEKLIPYSDFNAFSLVNNHIALNTLGKIYTSKKDYELALLYYQKAISINCTEFIDTLNLYALPNTDTKIYDVSYLLETLQNKALTLKAINTPKSLNAAFETNQLAIHWAEKMRQDFALQESKVNLNKNTSDLYKSAIGIAYELYNRTNDKKYLEEAFVIAEKQKGILLLESLIDEKGKQYYDVPQNLLERERQLKSDIAFYKQQMLEHKGKDETKYELYSSYHNSKNLEFGNLKDSLKTYHKTYFDAEYQTSIATIEKIQNNLLQPEQAFVQYIATDSLFYVFAIEKEKSHFLALPKGTETTANLQKIQEFLHDTKAVEEDALQTFENYKTVAYQGYQQVFEPVGNLLSETVNQLIIVPDDALNYLPFETLLGEQVASKEVDFLRLPYLIRDYQFHYGYSGTLLLENQKQYEGLKGNDQLLAYAPPYKEKEVPIAMRGNLATLRSSTVQLEGTSKEIQAIGEHFKGKFDFSENATKANFQEEAKGYGILHLAMHGKPNFDEPNYAHLVFSNIDNDTANLLHHYEITALETNAQLAVLSACETGVGKELAGEGVMSLGRAFMYAGVPSVVMSLWKMNDKSTSELMPLFYENLKNGARKDKALHQAKLDYLNNATSETAYPFYWAGFVSLGDGQPIKEGDFALGNKIWWIVGFVLLLLIGGISWKKWRN